MKSISLEELKDKHLGKVGTNKRDDYEYELKIEILSEQIHLSNVICGNLKS